jgi:hypothetical protein
VFNNPAGHTDPDGREIIFIANDKQYTYHNGNFYHDKEV